MSALASLMKHTVVFAKSGAHPCSYDDLTVNRISPKGLQTYSTTIRLPKGVRIREEDSILRLRHSDGTVIFGVARIARLWNYRTHLAIDIVGFVPQMVSQLPVLSLGSKLLTINGKALVL